MAVETPKIVDFGLARTLVADLHLTKSGVFYGTPSYAAPEQAEGTSKAIGPAAEIYVTRCDLVSPADRPPSLPGGDGPPDAGTGRDGRPGAAIAVAAGPAPGRGDDLPEMPGEGPAVALRRCLCPGRGSGPILGRAANPDTAEGAAPSMAGGRLVPPLASGGAPRTPSGCATDVGRTIASPVAGATDVAGFSCGPGPASIRSGGAICRARVSRTSAWICAETVARASGNSHHFRGMVRSQGNAERRDIIPPTHASPYSSSCKALVECTA
jgi:hypothetical protein